MDCAMKNKIIPVIITAALTSVFTYFLAAKFQPNSPFSSSQPKLPVNYASYTPGNTPPPANFENAAEASVQAVVHIKTQTKARTVSTGGQSFYQDIFGNIYGSPGQVVLPPQNGSGSGVVFTPDGYIVTNNHVIDGAEDVTVTFNDRYTANAKVVGRDPSTDIAVLKVNEKNLPYMEFGNSDQAKLGQWVLAVGYPLSLDATVTAGIISAKSRSIGINRRQSASSIESFIQTDAAVNPGNSGGALVNTSGQLIGINSAIASPTGSYAGYSYAIPANLVKKVVNDILTYGSVQRAYLGIEYIDPSKLTPKQLTDLGIDRNDGVYVANVPEAGSAFKAGLRKGDFITQINTAPISTAPELLEQIARYKPGDNITVVYTRNGKKYNASVELKNINGTTDIIKGTPIAAQLGAELRALTKAEKSRLGVSSGVYVSSVVKGIIAQQTNMQQGFVITTIDDNPVNTPEEIQQAMATGGTKQIGGFYPGKRGMYYYNLNIDANTLD